MIPLDIVSPTTVPILTPAIKIQSVTLFSKQAFVDNYLR